MQESKELEDTKKIIKKTLEKTNSVIVSRIKKEDYKKIILFAKKLKVKIETGKNSSSVLLFKKPIKFEGGKIGIMTSRDFRYRSRRRSKIDVRGNEL